jgi:hypothetical protein
MAGFVAAFFVQRRLAPTGSLISMWAWCVLFTNLSGFAMVVLGFMDGHVHDPVKMAIKGSLMTILGVPVLVLYFRKTRVGHRLNTAFGGLVLAEVLVSTLMQ